MLKKIRKGLLGILLPNPNSLSVSTTPFFNPLLSTDLSFGSPKIPLTVSNNLFKLLMGQINPFSYLTTIGVSMGNNTLAGIGLLGSTLQLGLPNLINNWSKFNNTQKTAGVSGLAGQVFDTLDNTFFSGKHLNDSALTSGLNSAYDATSNAAMMFSPVGTIVGGAMKAGKFLGDAIGLGTDQMTKTDLILDSSFMKLTPIGLANAFGAKRTKDFNTNLETIENVGADYGGSVATINDAESKANKKYGLFSDGARRKANNLIDKANTQLDIMTNISDTYQDLLANINLLAYTRYGMNLNGGYLQLNVRYAKYGASLNRIKTRKLLKGKKLVKPSYEDWLKGVNPNRVNPDSYDLETAYKVFPFELLEEWRNATDKELNKGLKHLGSVNPEADSWGNLWFLKLGTLEDNPELKGEFDWYNSEDAKDFREEYLPAKFDKDRNRYYYAPRHIFKDGGTLTNWQPTIELPENHISLWLPIIDIQEFKDGGKTTLNEDSKLESSLPNIIPEGALHAHKHHMENDKNITKKGIPVVDNDGELQAEIERNEIIFNLEVTKKLEELNKLYQESNSQKEKDTLAIEAGKLLVKEIMHNTIDRTGLIKECKKGGTL